MTSSISFYTQTAMMGNTYFPKAANGSYDLTSLRNRRMIAAQSARGREAEQLARTTPAAPDRGHNVSTHDARHGWSNSNNRELSGIEPKCVRASSRTEASMTDDTQQPSNPDCNDAEREQPAEDAPTPLVEDGDTVSAPDQDDEADDGVGVN